MRGAGKGVQEFHFLDDRRDKDFRNEVNQTHVAIQFIGDDSQLLISRDHRIDIAKITFDEP